MQRDNAWYQNEFREKENKKLNSALHPAKIARALQPWRKYPCAS